MEQILRLYLRLGDRVFHACHEEWGQGAVVETMTSTVVGGTCLVRILFEDGMQRTFHNDLDHEMCCSVMGIRREQSFDWDLGKRSRPQQRSRRLAAGRS